jgi:hypothetical protein
VDSRHLLDDAAALRAADAAYRPFPPLAAWAGATVPTALIDDELATLDGLRERADSNQVAGSLQSILRAAAFETGVIEGLYDGDRGITFAIAEYAAAWEGYLADRRGPDVLRQVRDQLAGYELALDAALDRRPLTEMWVRHAHEVVCASQATNRVRTAVGWQDRPLHRGRYKESPNHVRTADGSVHSYAPPLEVGAEMARLVEELRSDAFADAHPAIQAAFAHHALTHVHPFEDGNGRVARLLASVPILRAARAPLFVEAFDRPAYFNALEAADEDDLQRFVDWMSFQLVHSFRFLSRAVRQSLGEGSRWDIIGAEPPPLTTAQIAGAAVMVADAAVVHVEHSFQRKAPPSASLHIAKVLQIGERWPTPAGYVEGPDDGLFGASSAVNVALHARGESIACTFRVRIAEDLTSTDPFRIDWPPSMEIEPLALTLADVYPEVSGSTQRTLAAWADESLDRFADQLVEQLAP